MRGRTDAAWIVALGLWTEREQPDPLTQNAISSLARMVADYCYTGSMDVQTGRVDSGGKGGAARAIITLADVGILRIFRLDGRSITADWVTG